MPIEIAVASAVGQGIAFLGAVFAAISIFMSRGGTIDRIRKAASRGLFIVAIGMLVELVASISLIITPAGGS